MLTKATLFTGALWGYAAIEDEKLIEYRFGVILTVLMLALIGSPLFNLVNLSKYYINIMKKLFFSIRKQFNYCLELYSKYKP